MLASMLVPAWGWAAKTIQGGDPTGLFQPIGTFDVIAGNGFGSGRFLAVAPNRKGLPRIIVCIIILMFTKQEGHKTDNHVAQYLCWWWPSSADWDG